MLWHFDLERSTYHLSNVHIFMLILLGDFDHFGLLDNYRSSRCYADTSKQVTHPVWLSRHCADRVVDGFKLSCLSHHVLG